jgi:hypothetical protein
MFTKNIKDTFTPSLLNAVTGVLGEAKKKCSEGCECETCVAEKDETNEGYVNHAQRKAVWANRADDGKGHPDKKKKMKEEVGKLGNQLKREHEAKEKKEPNGVKTEETDDNGYYAHREIHGSKGISKEDWKKGVRMNSKGQRVMTKEEADAPFKGPYKKAGEERKDEYGNKVKNVAKYLAKKAMNTQKEEAEQIDEISAKTVDSYRQKAYAQQPAGDDGSHLYKKRKAGRDMAFKKVTHGAKVMAKEDIEELDEAPFDADSKTHDRHYEKQSDRVKNALDNYARRGMSYKQAYNKIRHGGTHVLRHEITAMHEESEQIDELSKKTLGSYVKKAANQSFSKGVSGGLALASRDPEVESQGVKIVNKAAKRMMGVQKAAGKLTKEESEQIDEISREALASYTVNAAHDSKKHAVKAALKSQSGKDTSKEYRKLKNREKGIETAVSRLTQEEQDFIDALNNNTLDEARGRPRKAGAKDFTINPKTKEKLMHNNPEHMKKIEALQRNGVIQAPKIEANQHIIQQLQRAKLSMRGGETINFTHGDSQHVAGHHAAKLLTKYAGMKPDEKEAFQKKIGHSHANLKSEL